MRNNQKYIQKKPFWILFALIFLTILYTKEKIRFILISTKEAIPATDIPKIESDWIIINKPLPFTQVRRHLTLEYINKHYDPSASSINIEPRMIVIHWTASETLFSLFSTFAPERLPVWRQQIHAGGQVNVSSHFAVDRDGTIYRLMSENLMARHVIGLNRSALGIENVGGPKLPLTSQQLAANARLVRYLHKKFPRMEYLIGHLEYRNFENSPLWEERDPSYRTEKHDPGKDFMAELRLRLIDLDLKGQP